MSFLSIAGQEGLRHPGVLDACGWSGEQGAVAALLDALGSDDPPRKKAAAGALYRIFGLPCFEKSPVVDEASAAASEPAGAGGKETDDPPPRRVKRLSQDALVWEQALRGFYQTRPGEGRLRHGQPWSRSSAVGHLMLPDGTFSERLVAAWEYAVVNRTAPPLHPAWFVKRQEQALRRAAG